MGAKVKSSLSSWPVTMRPWTWYGPVVVGESDPSGFECENQRMIRRVDLDLRAVSSCDDGVGVSAGRVGPATKDGGLGEELHAETGGCGEDAVHANAGRRWGPLCRRRSRFSADRSAWSGCRACAFRGEIERGAGGGSRRERSCAGRGLTGHVGAGGVRGRYVVCAAAGIGGVSVRRSSRNHV